MGRFDASDDVAPQTILRFVRRVCRGQYQHSQTDHVLSISSINFSTSTEVKRPAQMEVRQSAPVELGSPAPVEPRHPSRIRSSKDRSSVYQSISSQRGPLSTLSTAQMN